MYGACVSLMVIINDKFMLLLILATECYIDMHVECGTCKTCLY